MAPASSIVGDFICGRITTWFVDDLQRHGREILKERDERGAISVDRPLLAHRHKEHEPEIVICDDQEMAL
ncbi:MAG: hypothetical protein P1U62_08940 [Alteraurantiacibacter sp. bin_em_oilr2.035]|nr:hypothetical protein [Alteraurantiacibacter sp. bin_em_oilr2.035]